MTTPDLSLSEQLEQHALARQPIHLHSPGAPSSWLVLALPTDLSPDGKQCAIAATERRAHIHPIPNVAWTIEPVGEPLRRSLVEVGDHLGVAVSAERANLLKAEALALASSFGLLVMFDYEKKPGKVETRYLSTFRMIDEKVVGFDPMRSAVRSFRLDRIFNVQPAPGERKLRRADVPGGWAYEARAASDVVENLNTAWQELAAPSERAWLRASVEQHVEGVVMSDEGVERDNRFEIKPDCDEAGLLEAWAWAFRAAYCGARGWLMPDAAGFFLGDDDETAE